MGSDGGGTDTLTPFPADVVRDAARHPTSADYGPLVTTREGCYSALLPFHTPDTCAILEKHFPRLLRAGARVLDTTAGVGGDTLNLLHNYADLQVVAVEKDAAAAEALRQNLAQSGHAARCKVIEANAFAVLPEMARCSGGSFEPETTTTVARRAVSPRLEEPPSGPEIPSGFDFAYIDPPWGGKEVWRCPHQAAAGLSLAAPEGLSAACEGRVPLAFAVDLVFALRLSRAAVVKVPPNFRLRDFLATMRLGRLAAREAVFKRAAHSPTDPPLAYHLLVLRAGREVCPPQ